MARRVGPSARPERIGGTRPVGSGRADAGAQRAKEEDAMSSTIAPSPTAAAIEDLRASLRGALIQPGDPTYDAARRVYNAMIDKHPALIVRARDVADVIATVNFAREQRLLLAIRGGGHNGPGLGTCDRGVVLDLGLMRGVRVDPAARTRSAWPRRAASSRPPASAASPSAAASATSLANSA
jgi:hypothetical protein